MLDANIKTQLKGHFEKITQPVEIVASLDDGPKSREVGEFLDELAALSDRITLTLRPEASERKPSFSLNRPGEDLGIRFSGVPMGHEFTSLVLALLQVGGHAHKLSADTVAQIQALRGDYVFQTFVSLTCQNCPEVVQSLNLMAVLNPNIKVEMIEGGSFTEEVTAREIMSVPTIFMNGDVFGQGRMGVDELLGKMDSGVSQRDAERLNARLPYDVLVVGGGPAGAAAAIYAARKGIRTGLVAERFGGQVLDTMSIENFISVKETDGPHLVAGLEEHVKTYDVDIMNTQRAAGLTAGEQFTEVHLANGASLKSRTVIVTTGARWRDINVPGEKEYRNKGVTYCPHCDGPLFKGKRVAVVGGGNSGVEAAIDLAGIVGHVTLLEFDSALRADEVLQRKLRSLSNVEIIVHAQTTEVLGDGNKVTGLSYNDRMSKTSHTVDLQGVFVQIGLLPNTDWIKDTVALSSRGEVEVDDHGRTSVPGVFAAGDVTTTPFKQIVIAMGDGAKASLSAFDHIIRSPLPVDVALKATAEPQSA